MDAAVPMQTRLRVRADLHDELGGLVTKAGLSRFIGDSAIRANVLAGSIWGSIRWNKSLGRPNAATMAPGFSITQAALINIVYVDEHGKVDHWVTWNLGPASVWDGPDDDEHHRISYYFPDSSKDGTTIIRASFSPVGWPHTQLSGDDSRQIVPSAYSFDWTGTGPTVIPEQEVVIQPFSAGRGLSHLVWIDQKATAE